MWEIKEIKGRAKGRFKATYWKSVAAAAIYGVFILGSGSVMSTKSDQIVDAVPGTGTGTGSSSDSLALILAILGIISVVMIVSIVIRILVFNPLGAGILRFFTKNQDNEADFGEMVYCFKTNFKDAVVGLFLSDILTVVGLLLFIIPGLILTYNFRLVPYILADESMNCTGSQALKRSVDMMRGNKMKAFEFDLSYLGWDLLSLLTCGILQFFYVRPYKMNANARLYLAIKEEFLGTAAGENEGTNVVNN